MNTLRKVLPAAALLALAIHTQGCSKSPAHDDHAGHAHDEDPPADHNDHDDEDANGHADEDAEDVIRLTPEQLEAAGVVIEPLAGGAIATFVTLPGEVGLNQDTVLHVTPRVPGIVAQVQGLLGQHVQRGDLLAVLESPELGERKIEYLQALQARSVADAELDRQRTISRNTATLLSALRQKPELDALQSQVMDLRIGANKGRLLSAYARVRAARANYDRERELHEQNLSTESDLLAAQEAFNSSQADYLGAFEDIDFTYQLRLQEAERAARIADWGVDNANRRLHLLGLSDEQVEGITDEPYERVARYELTAAISGRIVAKHITPGEKLDASNPVYTLANLDTVWLNISVYSQYAPQIREHQRVTVTAGDRTTTGVVDYVSAVVSESTRTLAARVVIDNTGAAWKPGEFVTARVQTGERQAPRVVPLSAIQTFEGREVVFIQDADGIEPVAVRLGRRNDVSAELLGDDIPIGTPIVVTNSFLMKSELGKSAAGHEH